MEKKNTTIQTIIFIGLPIFLVILSLIMFINSLINNNTEMTVFWVIAMPVSLGILVLCLNLIKYCCPECNGFFCMKKVHETILSKKRITMQETRKVEKYSNYKKQYGNYETYTVDVPGIEYELDITYHCNKCGKYVTRREIQRQKL